MAIDLIRLVSNLRVDLADLRAIQENGRVAASRAMRHLLFGSDTSAVYSAKVALQVPFALSAAAPLITVTRGTGWVGLTLEDGTIEPGFFAGGVAGDSTQSLDLTGQPAGTYYVWVRASADESTPGSRFLWDAGAGEEVPTSINTRKTLGWRAVVTNSSSAPDARYARVGTASWDGASTLTVVTANGATTLFEGTLNSSGVETGAWGDGGSDRSTNRATNGTKSLIDFASAVRRQLKDIIGGSGWFSAVPTTARADASGLAADLTRFKAHHDAVSDPHGPTITLSGKATFNGETETNGILDVNGTSDFADEVVMHDALQLDGAGVLALPRLADSGEGSEDGYLVLRAFSPASWTTLTAWADFEGATAGSLAYFQTVAGNDNLFLPISEFYPGASLASEGPYLSSIVVYGADESGGGSAICLVIKLQRKAIGATAWTDLETWSIDNGDFGSTSTPATITLSLSGISDANRKMTVGYVYQLRAVLYTTDSGHTPKFYGVSVWTKHKYIHPS